MQRPGPITIQRMKDALRRRARPSEVVHWFVMLRPYYPGDDRVTQRIPRDQVPH